MSSLVTAIFTGLTAFSASNLDDLLILMLFFAQKDIALYRWQIVLGQYLGGCVLIIASLTGFFGSLIVPDPWIKLLGLIPIVKGLNRLLKSEVDASEAAELETRQLYNSPLSSFISPETYTVAAVEIAEGSDSVGVYMSLFANSNLESLLVTISVFFLLTGVWCYVAYKLTRLPGIADLLTRYGNTFVPPAFIGLGVFILSESHIFSLIAVVASYLFSITMFKKNGLLSKKVKK